VRTIISPALLIHGDYDTLVPLREAEDLYAHLGSEDKELVIIGGADHNNIMFANLDEYFGVIQRFIERTKRIPGER